MKLPLFTRNFYFLTASAFGLWMLFFDANDFITQAQLTLKLREMEREKKHYTQAVETVRKEKEEVFGDDKAVEKFAREKYLMKKTGEEIFVIVEPEKK
jgi:cell division protein DivIC